MRDTQGPSIPRNHSPAGRGCSGRAARLNHPSVVCFSADASQRTGETQQGGKVRAVHTGPPILDPVSGKAAGTVIGTTVWKMYSRQK